MKIALLIGYFFLPLQPLSERKLVYLYHGEMVEWSITTVLKTVVPRGTGGSNPSLSAEAFFDNHQVITKEF